MFFSSFLSSSHLHSEIIAGRYVELNRSCRDGYESKFYISNEGFGGYEWGCDITSISEVSGMDAIIADGNCFSEGDPMGRMRVFVVRIAPLEENLVTVIYQGDSPGAWTNTWKWCEPG